MSARFTVMVLVALGVCARAEAEPPLRGPTLAAPEAIEVEARSKRKIVATHAEDPSVSGTALPLGDRVTIPRSVGDVVREAPGALVLNSGGMGAFSAVSLRGADTNETQVLLDEIPLSAPDGGAFDLSLFPSELFGQINVFRGGAPVWLGSGAIGGVLQLVPRRGDDNALRASLGTGSYGTFQLQGGTQLSLPNGLSNHAQLLVRGTEGSYPYRDDRGTRFDATDDLTLRRKNADFMEASGLNDLTLSVAGGTLHLIALGVQRGGGFPGPGSQPTPKIRRESTRALVAASFVREADRDEARARRLQLVASGAYGADRFADLYGQLGRSKQTSAHDRSFRASLRAAGSLRLAAWLEGTLVGAYAFDTYLPFDAYAPRPTARSDRHSASTALELEARGSLGPLRFSLRPSARLEWSRTELHATRQFTSAYQRERSLVSPTARIGAALEASRGVALSASAATGSRLPTIFELFGDNGMVLPSFQLRPVRSITYDAGLSLRRRWGSLAASTELRGFLQERRDAIALYRTAQFQVGHENLPRVRQWGAEWGGRGSVGRYVDLSGSFTWLDTESALGKRLPFRPRFVSYVRPEAKLRFDGWISGASVSSELWHRSYAFVDGANLAYTDACLKVAVSAALTMFDARVRFSARMDDSADARCTDLVGYPLPGRSLFFSLSYSEVADANDS